jgi:glyoxylase-like metal-dependent hydrolase (beta-lactamase superfamily II)
MWIMEIKNGIYLLNGIRGANSYLSVTEDGIWVIDTGMPGNAERIQRQIKALNKTAKEIKLIILTHSDIDHSGSVAELKRITGAKVAIHSGDAPSLSGEKELKRVKGFSGVIFRLMARFMRFQTIKPDIILEDGDEIDNLRVIHTPGHTEGSICLYKTGDILFAGDAVKTDSRGNLKLSPSAMTLNVQEALDSVRKIATLEFDILLPGHGVPVMGKAATKLKELVVHAK